MSGGTYNNNRNRGRGGNRPYNNQNMKNRRSHEYQQSSSSTNQELGSVAKVTVKTGKVYEGIFKTYSTQLDIALEKVHVVDSSNPTNIPSKDDIQTQMIFKLDDIVSIQYSNVDPNYAISDNFTDGAISRKTNGQAAEKELQPWVPDANPDDAIDDGEIIDAGKSNGWDVNEMFRINRDKFQINSTYDPNMAQYTTPMPSHNTEEFRTYQENAAAVAREIESSVTYRQRVELENTKDEETLHSAVVRGGDGGQSHPPQKPPHHRTRPEVVQQHPDRVVVPTSSLSTGRGNKSYSNSMVPRDTSPVVVRQQQQLSQHVSKRATPQPASAEVSSTPTVQQHNNYSEAVAKKQSTTTTVANSSSHHHPGQSSQQSQGTAVSSHAVVGQSTFSQSPPRLVNNAPVPTATTGANGSIHLQQHHGSHVVDQSSSAAVVVVERKVLHQTVGTGLGSNPGGGSGIAATPASHQAVAEVTGGHHHHHQQQSVSHFKDSTIADQIKDLKEFQSNFNLTDASPASSSSALLNQQTQGSSADLAHNLASPVTGTPINSNVGGASAATPVVSGSAAMASATAPSASKPASNSLSVSADSASAAELAEKKKEVTSTLNPNANEFRPRTVPILEQPQGHNVGQQQQQQVMPGVNLSQQQQQQATPVHLQQQKAALVPANHVAAQQQQQQMMPSTVASPILYSHTNPAGLQQLVAAGPHHQVLYCASTSATQRYPAGAKRATVSARGNNEMATPQTANIMAGAPLISQNGLQAQMFLTPQQMMINAPYLNNHVRFMLPSPVIVDPSLNPMILPAPMLPHLAGSHHHGTPTAVVPANIHPLLQQQQQLVAQQQQQQQQQQQTPQQQQQMTSSSNGTGSGRPASNGSGAPTPVHYQGQPHHHQQQQAQQHQLYHGASPAGNLTLQSHATPQQPQMGGAMQQGAASGPTVQSQMVFSPFMQTFSNPHHPQSGIFTAAIPPPTVPAGAMQGQVPPGAAAALQHQLVQHHQLQPMIIASQSQQAAAQLGQFVTVHGMHGVPQGHSQPQLFYGMPPTIQQSMTGPNYQHGGQ